MGTTWSMAAYAPAGTPEDGLREAMENELDRVVQQMSHYREDSALSRYNRAPAGTWIAIPAEFFHVLDRALSIAEATEGAFDPALGGLVNAWGFGPPIDGPRTTGDWRSLALRAETQAVWQPGGVMLDLSAIAKGFAVDQMARALAGLGLLSYLVEIGGELRSAGVKPDGQPWWVTIEPPAAEFPDELLVALCNAAVATSGDYRKFLRRDGARLPHTMDPATAAPARSGVASVTVLHAEAMAADAYSTAMAVLGPGPGIALADRLGLAALLVARQPDGFAIHSSRAFQAMLDD
jgi:thiamine biosynthesis lipoprotein